MSENISQTILDFSAASIAFENSLSKVTPRFIDDQIFASLGGKTEQFARDLLIYLYDKHSDGFSKLLYECRRLADITNIAFSEHNQELVSLPMAYRAVIAVMTKEIDTTAIGDIKSGKEASNFCEFLSLSYLASAAISIKTNEVQKGIEFIFESSQAYDLASSLLNTGADESLEKNFLSKLAKSGANALHSKPGGSREKRENIKNIWMSGKYSNKDLCAEQECGALGMSFSAARKALMGLPNPRDLPSG